MSFRAFLVIITTAVSVPWHWTVQAISDPRKEYHSPITSGERRFLKASRDASQHETQSTNYTSNDALPDIPHELLRLSRVKGISSNNFNTSALDENELLRTRVKAEKGSADASYFLGLAYLYGLESLEPNEEIAATWFRKSADRGHTDAMCALGLLLFYGLGNVQIDKEAAKNYFRLASNEGDSPFAHWLYGKSLFEMASSSSSSGEHIEDMKEAGRLFEMVAKEIPQAGHQLAIMYEYGLVKAEDGNNFAKAAKLYERASQQGYAEATYHLALMYSYGRGFQQDYSKAAELFHIAATNPLTPHPPSTRYLAIIFANGHADPDGIPDLDNAWYWYDQCSVQTQFVDVQNLCREERDALLILMEKARTNLIAS